MRWITRDAGRRLAAGSFVAALSGALFATGPAGATQPPLPLPNPDAPAAIAQPRSVAPLAARSLSGTCEAMRGQVRRGNSAPSFAVLDLNSGKRICSLNPKRKRSLASNTKILTTTAILGRLGASHRFRTRLFADREIDSKGVLRGNLYLKGGGDPGLGTGTFLDRYLPGAGTDIDTLARQARAAGLKRVTGRLYGDESVFDSLRGVADSGFATSPWIGPLSGLSINAGYTGASLSRFSANPARLAATTLVKRLRKRGISLSARVALGRTPRSVVRRRPLAAAESEDMAFMARVTNVYSNNFFGEMLVKALGAAKGRGGSTSAGTRVVRSFAASLGATVQPVDGSGLTFSNRGTAWGLASLLMRSRGERWWGHFYRSLPKAGREGTVADRMKGTAAEGRCRTKTGTLTGVSTLSGYCFNRSGRRFAFSILMNGVSNTYAARAAQDRIAVLLAGL
jgi:D-alanyl-D-alanine carboxypeptidase/D-alanyl-D-alanine-endopeptidase (penicillin-binding protein 4)